MINFSIKEMDGNLEVKFDGDLDIDSTEIVDDELIPTMKKYKVVNIDFEDVPFVDSSGMGLLLNIVQTLKEKGIKVTIVKVRQDVLDVFELLQLPEIVGEGVFL